MGTNKKLGYFFLFFLSTSPFTVLGQTSFSLYHSNLITDEQEMAGKGYILYKDKSGFLWIGGNDGVSRYDGHSFSNYNIKEGLTQNYITDIKEDNDGKLFISSPSGISVLTGAPNKPFTPLVLPAEVLQISAILPEHINKIWIADEISQTIWLLTSNKIKKVEGINEPIYEMVKDKAGIIYAISRNRNLFIVKNDSLLVKIPLSSTKCAPNKELCNRLDLDKEGNAFYYDNSLNKLSPNKPYLTMFKAKASDACYNISTASNSNKQRILYKREQAKWLPIAELPAVEYSNEDLYAESNGNILYVSEKKGFYALTPKLYTQLTDNKLLCYGKMSTKAAFVIKFDSAIYNNKLAKYAYKLIEAKNILHIFKGKDGTIWFCTYNGLYYLTNGKGPLKHYNFQEPKKISNYNLVINAVEDYTGKTWFRTFYGIICYDGKKFFHWDNSNGFNDNTIYSMVVDGKGKVYAGGNLLHVIINDVPVNISTQIGLLKSYVYSLATDRGGNVWVSPNYDKLYQIKQNNKGAFYKSDSLTLQINDLPIDSRSITFDSAGNLWAVGTNIMVIYLLQPSGKFLDSKKIVFLKPQFLENEKNIRMHLNTNEDKTVVYLDNTAFNAAEVIRDYKTEVPKLVLTDIMLDHKKTNWLLFTDSINKYGIPTSLTLKSNQNNLSFYFTGISFTDGSLTRYSYKLEGLENEWRPLTDITIAEYTNLSAGDYTFCLKSINQNGQWSETIKFSFTILPIWYKTPQAKILWGFIIVVMGLGISKWRVNKIKYNAGIEKLLIEQRLKALRAQINPHFIHNSMEFLMQAIEKETPKNAQNIVEMLSIYLKNILLLSDKDIISLEDELQFSEEYLLINIMLFKNNFQYKIEIDDTIDSFSIKVPCLLLQPFLENAFKYGRNNDNNQETIIHIKIATKGRFVCCEVTNTYDDDDKVNDTNYVPKGISITEERMSLLYPKENKRNLVYFNKENNLYKATICIPL